MKRYILIYQNSDEGGIRLIGPFADRETLTAWGREWQARNGDDPRWHEVTMLPYGASDENVYLIPIEAPSIWSANHA